MGKTSKFKYEPIPDEAMHKATQSGGDFDSYLTDLVKFQKVDEGEHTFRIIPRTWGSKVWGVNWFVEGWLHRDIGPDMSAYLCPLKIKGNPCPICEAISEMDSDRDDKEIDKIKARRNYYAYIVDRKAPKEGIKVWRFGVKLRRNLTLRCQDKQTGAWLQITDPNEGYDISFRREGSGLNTEYVGEDVARNPSPLSEKDTQQEAWLNFAADNPLPDQFVIQDYEYLDRIFRGKRGSKQDRADDKAMATASQSLRADVQEEEEEEEVKTTQPARQSGGKTRTLEPVNSDMLLKMDDEELTMLATEYKLGLETDGVPVKRLRREVMAALEDRNLLVDEDEPAPKDDGEVEEPVEMAARPGSASRTTPQRQPAQVNKNGGGKAGGRGVEVDEGEPDDVVAKAKKSLDRLRPGARG